MLSGYLGTIVDMLLCLHLVILFGMYFVKVVAEKKKLEHEVTSLQSMMEDDRKEIAELRRHQQVWNYLSH